jgi:hypothetical protein
MQVIRIAVGIKPLADGKLATLLASATAPRF